MLKQKQNLAERLERNEESPTIAEQRRFIEIEEAIEAIDLAIDFQNNVINKRERDVEQSIRASQVKAKDENRI